MPAESIHVSSEGKFESLPQDAQLDTLIGTELARGQGTLETHQAQRMSAPQPAERRQRSQHAEHSRHPVFTATVSMTAKCRHQSTESCNSNSSIVSHCCATMHHSEVNSSLSIHASVSPRKSSKAVIPGRQGKVAEQSVLLANQHESLPEQLQLQEQLPKQSSIMTGQHESVPAQLQLQEQLSKQSSFITGQRETGSAQLQLQMQLPTHPSPEAAPVPTGICAGPQGVLPVTMQPPQPVTSHSMQQPMSSIISSKSLSRASSIVAAPQAVSCSSSTVHAEAHSLRASQGEVPRVPQGDGQTQPRQQAEADSCSTPAQPTQRPEPVCSGCNASSMGQPSSQAAAGREPVERKSPLPAVLRRASSETMLTNASQVRAGHGGRLASAQQSAAQAQPATLPGSDSTSSARHKMHAESSAPQLRPATLPRSDSASSATHGVQTEGSALQPRLAALAGSDSTSSARRADCTAPQLQPTAVSGSGDASSARHGMHNLDSCQVQPQSQQQAGLDTSREGSRQQAVPSAAGTQRPQLRQEMRIDSSSSSMQVNSQSDIGVQQEVSQLDCSSSSSRPLSQSSCTTQQVALQPNRRSRHKLLQPSYSAQQEVLQPVYSSHHGASRAEGSRDEGLALLQEQSQLALATQGSCSELSREGLEEDNCRLRRALAAIEQQLGMIRNQQVT